MCVDGDGGVGVGVVVCGGVMLVFVCRFVFRRRGDERKR